MRSKTTPTGGAEGYIIKQSRVDELVHQRGVRRLLPSASHSDAGHVVSSWLGEYNRSDFPITLNLIFGPIAQLVRATGS